MAKAVDKKAAKKRSATYEWPIICHETCYAMIAMSTNGAGVK